GACNQNHICEPDESYEVCPQDCYWHSEGAEVFGKPSLRSDAGPWPGMAPAPGEPYERVGNGVCELRENWRFSPDCARTCGDGTLADGEALTCLADVTLPLAADDAICDRDSVCEFQDDPALAALLSAQGLRVPQETAYNCPLDCTPMGPDPLPNIFVDDYRDNDTCDPHENHDLWPQDCATGCHDGCCAPGEDTSCPEDCGDSAIACPACTGDACTPHCGDGNKDPGEPCDDGNADNTDACLDTCQPAACGDGFIHQGVELCDDANTDDTDACSNACTPTTSCGDGTVDPGETCDDANTDNSDACLDSCVPASCGDGFTHQGVEQCDDANPDNTDACLDSCIPAACGDGFTQQGVEDCDDQNLDNTDACLDSCIAASCGDGFTQQGVEQCDDANTDDTDACSNDCIAPRRVFILSPGIGTGGKLGGIDGADSLCQTRAASAGLSGTFKAWLTDSDPDSAPATRFDSTSFSGWYLGTDGSPIAHGWQDLTSLDDNQTDFLKAPIRADEFGMNIGSEAVVWTNTSPNGEQDPMNKHCDDWTSSSSLLTGTVGLSAEEAPLMPLTASWTQLGDADKCTSDYRLYCFQTSP
ncbi:MAG: DUF4215 domain-containing protein, partial [Myxococcales bacterium]|nr:DUF4215 domain-containing protein [Myxococcales bacterium]